MADFTSYVETQMKVDEFYKNKEEWAKASLANIANMGYFSSDRSIIDYAEKIWNVKPKF